MTVGNRHRERELVAGGERWSVSCVDLGALPREPHMAASGFAIRFDAPSLSILVPCLHALAPILADFTDAELLALMKRFGIILAPDDRRRIAPVC